MVNLSRSTFRLKTLLACLVLTAVAGGALLDDFEAAEWKREIAGGYLPYGKIAYADFPVSDGYPTPHLIRTIGFFHYSFRSRQFFRDGQYVAQVSEISVRSGFDQNRSWKKSSFTEKKALLAHEQGHLDINELHVAAFRKEKKPEGLGSNPKAALEDLSAKLQVLADRFGNEARVEQDKYDEETNHGANEAKQKEWRLAIRRRFDTQGLDHWDKP